MQVSAFLQDDQLSELAKLLALSIKECLQRWAAYGGPGPARQPTLTEISRTAEAIHSADKDDIHGADEFESPRQRPRVVKAAAEVEVSPTAAERALDILQALPPSAAASALAATGSGLWTMLAALPPALHGAALQALCTAVPTGKLRLRLDFATNRDRLVPRSGAGALAPGLRSLGGLASLKAFNTTPTDLCELLRACSGLQALSSVAVEFAEGARLWPGFEREFAPLTCLRALDLGTHEADHGLAPLPGGWHATLPFVLCGVLPSLQRLRWCGNVTGTLAARTQSACTPAELTWLELRNLRLGDCERLHTCSAQLGGLSRLRRLCLSDCGFTSTGMAALAAALPPTPELTYFHFGSNSHLRLDGLAAVAQIIERAAALRSMDVADVSLHQLGESHMAAALGAATDLTGLCFDGCSLGAAGMRALVTVALPSLSKLRVLEVQHDDMPKDVALALVAAVKHLTALRRVALWGCDSEYRAVRRVLKQFSGQLARSLYKSKHAWVGKGEPSPDSRWKSDGEDSDASDGSEPLPDDHDSVSTSSEESETSEDDDDDEESEAWETDEDDDDDDDEDDYDEDDDDASSYE